MLLHIVNHTKTGMAMRAVSKDYEIARVMGVDIDKNNFDHIYYRVLFGR